MGALHKYWPYLAYPVIAGVVAFVLHRWLHVPTIPTALLTFGFGWVVGWLRLETI